MEIGTAAELKRGPGPDKSRQSIKAELNRGGASSWADSLCDVHCSTCCLCLSQRARQDDLRHEETANRPPYTAARIYSSLLSPLRRRRTHQPPPHHPAQRERACDRELPAPCSSFRAHCSTLSLFSLTSTQHPTHTARRLLHLVHASCDVANGHSFLTNPPPTLSLTFSFYQQQHLLRAGHLTRPNYIHHEITTTLA